MSWLPPTLVAIWLFGIVPATWVMKKMIHDEPLMQMSLELEPWRLILASLMCVAWPGVLLVSLITPGEERLK